jgi:hypothetical protein
MYQCISPLAGIGDIVRPELQHISSNLYMLPGDVSLSSFEDTLSSVWPESMGDNNLYRPMRIITAFWQVMQMAADQVHADLILVDIGPNLGAINRSVLIATNYVVIPLGADLFSLQGLKNLGPTLRSWKTLWQKRLDNWSENAECCRYPDFRLPQGKMQPVGYLCQQHGVRLDRPVKAYDKWVQRIPEIYRKSVLNVIPDQLPERQEDDPYCLATIRHYRSLIPMAQEHRKPIFNLTSADGAIGSHANAVQDAKQAFKLLASRIAGLIGMPL